ncbi:hypothetical protein X728_26405 [Mesorhizobium sp. L103C120A0]|nr:hypothetical protein X728_26405 [Mesorhizobium sp. L103C120A0]
MEITSDSTWVGAARHQRLSVSVCDIDRDELKNADEVFISSTAGGIMPVTKIDETVVSEGKVGTLTRQLTYLYWEKHADPAWSTPVPSAGRAVLQSADGACIFHLSNELATLSRGACINPEG